MFGFQRIGDLIWAAADMRCRGFLVGGTAGRTTLAGEGLQHQDGHSHVLALPVPNLLAYDPAFAYEIAIIIQDGIRRMYVNGESIFYYLTVTNEPLPMPEMPKGENIRDGVLKGLYRFKASGKPDAKLRAQLLGSGTIMFEVLKAQQILQLQATLSRRQRLRALEHAASHQSRQGSLRHPDFAGRVRTVHRSFGLYESAPREPGKMGAGTTYIPRHRWLRPQRRASFPARLFRGRRQAHCPGDAGRAKNTSARMF
jgi:pyruvate dehydrogenase complex dehydrogenase (E1) component